MFKLVVAAFVFFAVGTVDIDLSSSVFSKLLEDIISTIYGLEILETAECSDVEDSKINIYLSTSSDPDTAYHLTPSSLGNLSHFNASLRTKFATHGWIGDYNSGWLSTLRSKYFEKGDYNVFILGWGSYAFSTYTLSHCYLKKIGPKVGQFLYNASKQVGIDLNKTHLIGHSLGAQLMAFVGQEIQILTGGRKVRRLSALDPAGPLFCQAHLALANQRLSEDDAIFVDVIHTNAGEFGCSASVGDTDFYPNCGEYQPGCNSIDFDLTDLLDITNFIKSVFDTEGCSHVRAYEYWIESILSDGFKAQQRSSCTNYEGRLCSSQYEVIMGDDASESNTGDYYLTTNSESPYARG